MHPLVGLEFGRPQFQGLEWGPRTRPKPIIRAIRLAVSVASEGQGPTGALIACAHRPQFHRAVVSTSGWKARSVQACMGNCWVKVCKDLRLHIHKPCMCMQFAPWGLAISVGVGAPVGFTHPGGTDVLHSSSKPRKDQPLKCLVWGPPSLVYVLVCSMRNTVFSVCMQACRRHLPSGVHHLNSYRRKDGGPSSSSSGSGVMVSGRTCICVLGCPKGAGCGRALLAFSCICGTSRVHPALALRTM